MRVLGPLAPFTAFQDGRVELDATGLRDGQLQLAQAAEERLGLEAIGMAATFGGALVGFGMEHGGAFQL